MCLIFSCSVFTITGSRRADRAIRVLGRSEGGILVTGRERSNGSQVLIKFARTVDNKEFINHESFILDRIKRSNDARTSYVQARPYMRFLLTHQQIVCQLNL